MIVKCQVKKSKPFLKGIALITLNLFFVTNVVWADAAQLLQSIPKSQPIQNEKISSNSWFEDFKIPEEIGSVSSKTLGHRPGTIIHIQDAHANEEAQRNISKIINYLSKHHHLKTVHLEGAEGALYTDVFTSFSSKESRLPIADYLLAQARLSGGEYSSIIGDPAIKLYGVEDRALYEKNRNAYLKVTDQLDRNLDMVQNIQLYLDHLARFVFSQELREFYEHKDLLESKRNHLESYIRFLFDKLGQARPTADIEFRRVNDFIKLAFLEQNVDFEEAKKRMPLFLNDFESRIESSEKELFLRRVQQMKDGALDKNQFYEYLNQLIVDTRNRGAEEEGDENTLKYIQFMAMYHAVDLKLFDEIEELERKVLRQMLKNEEQEKLSFLYEILSVYRKMFEFHLTQKDVKFYYDHKSSFNMNHFVEWIEDKLVKYHSEKTIQEDYAELDDDLVNVEEFYLLALERDEVLLHRTLENAKLAQDDDLTVLITGGFHTSGIEEGIKEDGYSHIVVTPSIKSEINTVKESELYDDALRGKVMQLEDKLMNAILNRSEISPKDPRFQLSAWQLIFNQRTGEAQLATLAKLLKGEALNSEQEKIKGDMLQGTRQSLALYMGILMHVSELFRQGSQEAFLSSWHANEKRLKQNQSYPVGAEVFREVIAQGHYYQQTQQGRQIFALPASLMIDEKRLVMMKYPKDLGLRQLKDELGVQKVYPISFDEQNDFVVERLSDTDLELLLHGFDIEQASLVSQEVIEDNDVYALEGFERRELRTPSRLSRRELLQTFVAGALTAGLPSVTQATEVFTSNVVDPVLKAANEIFSLKLSPVEVVDDVNIAMSVEIKPYQINHTSLAMFQERLKSRSRRDLMRTTALQIAKELNLPTEQNDFYTDIDWAEKLLLPISQRFELTSMYSGLNPEQIFLEELVAAVRDAKKWLSYGDSNNPLDENQLFESFKRYAKFRGQRIDSSDESQIRSWIRKHGIQRIEHNDEVPEFFRTYVGVVSIADWVKLNETWAKTETGKNTGVKLDTFMGISMMLAMSRMNYRFNTERGVAPVGTTEDGRVIPPAKYWNRPENFFADLYLVLNRPKRTSANFGINRLLQVMRNYLSHTPEEFIEFDLRVVKEAKLDAVSKMLRIFKGRHPLTGKRSSAYKPLFAPVLENSHIDNPIVTAKDLAQGLLPAYFSLRYAQLQINGKDGDHALDILEGYLIPFVANIHTKLINHPSYLGLYNQHDDPKSREIMASWKRGDFSIEPGARERQSPTRRILTPEDIKQIDPDKVSADVRHLRDYILATDRAEVVDEYFHDRSLTADMLEAIVGNEVGRSITWIRLGFEEDLIILRRQENGRFGLNMDALYERFEKIDRLYPYVEMFLGKKLNLNNTEHIGIASAMVQNIEKLGLDEKHFELILLKGSRMEGILNLINEYKKDRSASRERIKQLEAFYQASEGFSFKLHEKAEAVLKLLAKDFVKFSFDDQQSGPEQIGFMMRFLMESIVEGEDTVVEKLEKVEETVKQYGLRNIVQAANRAWQEIGEVIKVEFEAIENDLFSMTPKTQGRLMAFIDAVSNVGLQSTIKEYAQIKIVLNDSKRLEQLFKLTQSDFLGFNGQEIEVNDAMFKTNTDVQARLLGLVVSAINESSVVENGNVNSYRWDEWVKKQQDLIPFLLNKASDRNELRMDVNRRQFLGVAATTAAVAVAASPTALIAQDAVNPSLVDNSLPQNFSELLDSIHDDPKYKDLSIPEKISRWLNDSLTLGENAVSEKEYLRQNILSVALRKQSEVGTADVVAIVEDSAAESEVLLPIPSNTRNILIEESQKLLDFKTQGRSDSFDIQSTLRKPGYLKSKATNLLRGWAKFRLHFEDDVERSWRETEGLADKIISTLTEMDSHAAGKSFFQAIANLYVIDDPRAEKNEWKNISRLDEFRDTEAWDFLIAITAWLVMDSESTISYTKDKSLDTATKYALHLSHLAQITTDHAFEVGVYYENAGLGSKPLNLQDEELLNRSKAWGNFSSLLRGIESIHGTLQLTPELVTETLEGLIKIQEVAKTPVTQRGDLKLRWNELNEGQALSYYKLFYTRSRRPKVISIDELQNEAGEAISIEDFFELAAYVRDVRVLAAHGDEETLNQPGLLDVLNYYKTNPSKRPEWMSQLDLEGSDESRFFDEEGQVKAQPGLIDVIAGNPERGIEKGLSQNKINDGEAIQFVLQYLDHLIDHQKPWKGLETAKKDFLNRTRWKMFLQAAYMIRHKDAEGNPVSLEVADISSSVTQIEQGKTNPDLEGEILRRDGKFIELEKVAKKGRARLFKTKAEFLEAKNNQRLKAENREAYLKSIYARLGLQQRLELEYHQAFLETYGRSQYQVISERLGYDLAEAMAIESAARFPIMDRQDDLGSGQRLGFVVRMQQQGKGDEWLEDWFDDVVEIQLASFLANGSFIEAVLVPSVVERFRPKGDKPLARDPSQYYLQRMRTYFREGVAQTDSTFANLETKGNQLKRLLWTLRSVENDVPEERLPYYLELWDRLASNAHYKNTDLSIVHADQSTLITKMHLASTTFTDLFAERVYQKNPDAAIGTTLKEAKKAIRKLLTEKNQLHETEGPLLDLLINMQSRITIRTQIRERNNQESRALQGLRELIKERRPKGSLPKGISVEEIKADLESLYQDYKGDKNAQLGRRVDAIVSSMEQNGFGVDEAFYFHVVLDERAEKAFRAAMNIGSRKLDVHTEKTFVSALAERMLDDWGFVTSQERKDVLERLGVTIELIDEDNGNEQNAIDRLYDRFVERDFIELQLILSNAKQIQEMLHNLGKTDITLDDAYRMANNTFNSGVSMEDVKKWVWVVSEVLNIAAEIEIDGKPIQSISIEDALYLVDSWLKMGLSAEPIKEAWSREDIGALVDRELDRLAQAEIDLGGNPLQLQYSRDLLDGDGRVNSNKLKEILKNELYKGRTDPIQLKLLVEEVLALDARIRKFNTREFTDQSQAATKIRRLSFLDLLLYQDFITPPLRKLSILDLLTGKTGALENKPEINAEQEKWTKKIEEQINSTFRKQISRILNKLPKPGREASIEETTDRLTASAQDTDLFRDAGVVTVVMLTFLTALRSFSFNEKVSKSFKATVVSSNFLKPATIIFALTFLLPELIIWFQFNPYLAVVAAGIWLVTHYTFNQLADITVRSAPYLADGKTVDRKFVMYRVANALTQGGTLFLTLAYVGVMNPFAIWTVVGAIAFVLTFDLLRVIIEVGIVQFLGDIFIGSRSPAKIKVGETPQMQKERVVQDLDETGRVLRVIMPFYVNNPKNKEKEDAEITSAINNLTRTLEGNDHKNIIGVLILNTPRYSDLAFRKTVVKIARKILSEKGIDPNRLVIPIRPGLVKQINYQSFLWWARTGENFFNPETQAPSMRAFAIAPTAVNLNSAIEGTETAANQFFSGFLSLQDESGLVVDFEDPLIPENHPIQRVRYKDSDKNEKGMPLVRSKSLITDADNFLEANSAWPLLDALIQNEPEIDTETGQVTNGKALFIQPKVGYHNLYETLWSYSHNHAQIRLWFTQRFMSTLLGGVRGFGKFAFDDTYVDVMLQPYADFPEGRYAQIVRMTSLWDKAFDALNDYLRSLSLRAQKREFTSSDVKLLLKANEILLDQSDDQRGILYVSGLENKIAENRLTDEEVNSLLGVISIEEHNRVYKHLLTFFKSEDEIHTNVVNQAGSSIALQDDGPGPNWGGVVTIVSGIVPALVVGFFGAPFGLSVVMSGLLWSGVSLAILSSIRLLNHYVHSGNIPMPNWSRFVAVGVVSGITFALMIPVALSIGFWGLLGVVVASSVVNALIVNLGRPVIKGSNLKEGFPRTVEEEEKREIKWQGDFDIPNMLARAEGAVGIDIASRHFSNLVANGLKAEQKWRLLLVITWASVLYSGILEVFLPFGAEIHFFVIMLSLMHMVISIPVLRFLNDVGRFDSETGFLKNVGKNTLRLEEDVISQLLEWSLSALIYINKLFIKDPVLVRGLVGLRAQLKGGANPWKVAAQVFTVDNFSVYVNLLAAPFSFGANVLTIFLVSAAGLAGTLTAQYLLAPLVLFVLYKYIRVLLQHRFFEKDGKLTDIVLQWPARSIAIGAGATAIFFVANFQIPLALMAVSILAGAFIANAMVNALIVAPLKFPASEDDSSDPRIKRMQFVWENVIGFWASLMHFVPFVTSLVFLVFAPTIANVIDWDWVLRAAPLMFAFVAGPGAAYVASFGFFSETDKDAKKNEITIKVFVRIIAYGAVAGAFVIGSFPLAEYLNHVPIFLFGPAGDGNLALFSHLLRIPSEFAFVHNYISASGIIVTTTALVLWLWRNLSLFLPKSFPLRLVQKYEERGFPEDDELIEKHKKYLSQARVQFLVHVSSFVLAGAYAFFSHAMIRDFEASQKAGENIENVKRSEGVFREVTQSILSPEDFEVSQLEKLSDAEVNLIDLQMQKTLQQRKVDKVNEALLNVRALLTETRHQLSQLEEAFDRESSPIIERQKIEESIRIVEAQKKKAEQGLIKNLQELYRARKLPRGSYVSEPFQDIYFRADIPNTELRYMKKELQELPADALIFRTIYAENRGDGTVSLSVEFTEISDEIFNTEDVVAWAKLVQNRATGEQVYLDSLVNRQWSVRSRMLQKLEEKRKTITPQSAEWWKWAKAEMWIRDNLGAVVVGENQFRELTHSDAVTWDSINRRIVLSGTTQQVIPGTELLRGWDKQARSKPKSEATLTTRKTLRSALYQKLLTRSKDRDESIANYQMLLDSADASKDQAETKYGEKLSKLRAQVETLVKKQEVVATELARLKKETPRVIADLETRIETLEERIRAIKRKVEPTKRSELRSLPSVDAIDLNGALAEELVSQRLQKAISGVQEMTFNQLLNEILGDDQSFQDFTTFFVESLYARYGMDEAKTATSEKPVVLVVKWQGIENATDLKRVYQSAPGNARLYFMIDDDDDEEVARSILGELPESIRETIFLRSEPMSKVTQELIQELEIDAESALHLDIPDTLGAQVESRKLRIPLMGIGAEFLKKGYQLVVVTPDDMGLRARMDVPMSLIAELLAQWQISLEAKTALERSA